MYNKKLKVCCTCGKVFYPAVMHQYRKKWKRKTYIACSYKCYTKLVESIEREKDDAKKR